MAVAGARHPFRCDVTRQNDRHVVRLNRGSDLANGVCEIDVADLFGPEIVFRHEGEATIRPQAARRGNLPASFLEHFAMKSGDGLFARVNAATGELQLLVYPALKGQKQVAAHRKDSIDSGARAIGLIGARAVTKASIHIVPLGPSPIPIIWTL